MRGEAEPGPRRTRSRATVGSLRCDGDRIVAEALARKRAVKREKIAEAAERVMRDRYTIERDTWAVMSAALLAAVLEDCGSIRKAAAQLSVPRSTLGAWVSKHRANGSWPT